MQVHFRTKPRKPLLIAFRERPTRPKNPIGQIRENALRRPYGFPNLIPSCVTDGFSRVESIPPTLPAVPAARLAKRARCMQFQVELDTGLSRARREVAIFPVMDADYGAAHVFKIGLCRAREALKFVPI